MKLVKLLSIVIVGLILTNVTLTNRAVDQSVVVSDLTRQIAELDHSNALQNARIAEVGSLTALSEAIEAAGFIASPKIVSLPTISSVASR